MDIKLLIGFIGLIWAILIFLAGLIFKAGKLSEKTDNQQKDIEQNRANIGEIFTKIDETNSKLSGMQASQEASKELIKTRFDMLMDIMKKNGRH